jgi:hypothetical protein
MANDDLGKKFLRIAKARIFARINTLWISVSKIKMRATKREITAAKGKDGPPTKYFGRLITIQRNFFLREDLSSK